MVIGLIAGIGKWRLGRHGLLFLLLFVQLWLAWVGFELPFPVGFLHPDQRRRSSSALCGWIVVGRVAALARAESRRGCGDLRPRSYSGVVVVRRRRPGTACVTPA